ncbi:MAG: hypothetical protein JXR83_23000 [Deltaproteobacteria bacterium]|nr:hypothetical protein [Deltaproteobacteria bacterium]
MISHVHRSHRARSALPALFVMGASWWLAAPVAAQGPDAQSAPAEEIPELAPIDSAASIQELWRRMRAEYNRSHWGDVCEKLDALRRLDVDISASRLTAAFAYLKCSRLRAMGGDVTGAKEYLDLSIQYGGRKPEHDHQESVINRIRGMDALHKGDLESALRLFEVANARGGDAETNRMVADALTQYAFEQHGRGDDVKALAAIDAAMLFVPKHRDASYLSREIWFWQYGIWIFGALLVFLIAIFLVYRQWREVRIREVLEHGPGGRFGGD